MEISDYFWSLILYQDGTQNNRIWENMTEYKKEKILKGCFQSCCVIVLHLQFSPLQNLKNFLGSWENKYSSFTHLQKKKKKPEYI